MKDEATVKKLLDKARRTNAHRDEIDHQSGFAPPGEPGCDRDGGNRSTPREDLISLLATAHSAIECGMRTEDWNAVAEGAVMLEDAVNKLRKDQGRGERGKNDGINEETAGRTTL